MADARSKAVYDILAPLWAEKNYGVDIAATNMREPLGMSDIIDIPDISELTVTASGASTTSAQSITTNALSLNANLEPWINAALPQLASAQLLDGRWAAQVGAQSVSMLKNSMDSAFAEYLIARNWTSAATPTYHVNVASNSLTASDMLTAVATLTENKGVDESDLIWWMSSWGRASLSNISGFVPNMTTPAGTVNGIPAVGTLYGIPVYASSAVPNGRTVASTSWADDGSEMLIILPEGHGIVAGQIVSFASTTSSNDFSSAVVAAASALTITVPTVASGSASEAGTVTIEASENLLISKSSTYTAIQSAPKTRLVSDPTSTGTNLQVSAIWGRVSRVGRAIVVCSPKSSV